MRSTPVASNRYLSAVFALLCLSAVHADAAPRTLVDRTLARTSVSLLGWNEDSLSYTDSAGQMRKEPIERYIAILPGTREYTANPARPDDEDIAGGTPVIIELTDGQRLIGSVGPWDSSAIHDPADDRDLLTILTPAFGSRTLPLDELSRILIDPWKRPPSTAQKHRTADADDELILINGDRMLGFLVDFADEVTFDTGTDEVVLDLDRIAEIRLGNPKKNWNGPRIWWSTGDVRAARATGRHGDGTVYIYDEPGSEPIGFSINLIDAAWLDEGRIIPLGILEISDHNPLGDRRWDGNVRTGSRHRSPLGTPHIVLPGPMRVCWNLPPEASRFGTIARLGGTLDRPTAEPGRWADAILRISVADSSGQTELGVFELNRDTPSAPITLRLPNAGEFGRTLVIELLPGRFGSIQDRVLLDRPMLTEL